MNAARTRWRLGRAHHRLAATTVMAIAGVVLSLVALVAPQSMLADDCWVEAGQVVCSWDPVDVPGELPDELYLPPLPPYNIGGGGGNGDDGGDDGGGSIPDNPNYSQAANDQTQQAKDQSRQELDQNRCNQFLSGANPSGGTDARTVLQQVGAGGRIIDRPTHVPDLDPYGIVYAGADG